MPPPCAPHRHIPGYAIGVKRYDSRLGGRYECLRSLIGELSKVGKEMNVEVRGET